MKKMLAWSIVYAFVSLTPISSLHAASSDSTSRGFTSSANSGSITQSNPYVNLGSPYTVEEGHGPIAGISNSVRTSGDPNSGSYLEVMECNNTYCIVRSLTRKYTADYQGNNDPDICPQQMKPTVSVDPDTSAGSVSGFACLLDVGLANGNYGVTPTNIGEPYYASDYDSTDPGHYWVYAVVSSRTYSTGSNQVTVPGNGFDWKIVCLPTQSEFVPYRRGYYQCVSANVQEYKKPLEWEHGIVSVSNNGNSHVVTTNRRCPEGKIPYAVATTIGPNTYTSNNNNFSVINSYNVCVRNIVNDPNNDTRYKVTILYGAATTPISKDSSQLTINDANRSVPNGMVQLEYTLFCYAARANLPRDAATNKLVDLYGANSNGGANGPCNPNNPPYNGH